MINRDRLMHTISRSFSIWSTEIDISLKSGRTDIMMEAEEISRNLLNMTFDYDLKPLDRAAQSFPAIDLADEDRRVAVQVTANNTRAKVQNTLTRFLDQGLSSRYHKLLVFILTAAPKFRLRVDFSVPDGLELEIMTLVDLFQELKRADTTRLEKVARYLDEVIGSDAAGTSTEAAPAALPPGATDGLSEAARNVLDFARLLPPSGLERNVFEHGLEPEQRKELPELLERGLLHQKGPILFRHPGVQGYIRSSLDHRGFLDRLWDYEKSWHWDRVSLTREIALKKSLAALYDIAAESFPGRLAVYLLRSAELYRDTQQYKEALRLEQKVLPFLESYKDHWGAARAHHFAGECRTALQEHADALKEWQTTLSLCVGPLHASGLDLAEALHNVGRALTALEQYADAEQELLNALRLLEAFRKTCPDFAPQPWMKEIYDSLATVYTKRNRNRLAALCSQNALRSPAEQEELWPRLSTEEQPVPMSDQPTLNQTELAAKFSNAGYAAADRGDYAQALEHLQKALAIQERVLPPEHPDIAATYENMGYTYGDLGNHSMALEYHSRALAIRINSLPPEHPDIARSDHNLAWVYHDMGEYQAALLCMRRAVLIAEHSLPEDHPDRIKYRTDLEELERAVRQ